MTHTSSQADLVAFLPESPEYADEWTKLARANRAVQGRHFLKTLDRYIQYEGHEVHHQVRLLLTEQPCVQTLTAPESYAWSHLTSDLLHHTQGEALRPSTRRVLDHFHVSPRQLLSGLRDCLGYFAAAALSQFGIETHLSEPLPIWLPQRLPGTSTILTRSHDAPRQGVWALEGYWDNEIQVSEGVGSASQQVAPCFHDGIVVDGCSQAHHLGLFSKIPVEDDRAHIATWLPVLEQAVSALASWRAWFATLIPEAVSVVVPWRGDGERRVPPFLVDQTYSSASVGYIPGTCWLTVGDDPLLTAEALIHEVAHQILHHIEVAFTLVADEAALIHSPWQPLPRPVRGVLHGLFVFAHVLDFWRTCLDAGWVSSTRLALVRGRIALLEAQLAVAGEVLEGEWLTDAGQGLARQILDRTRPEKESDPFRGHVGEVVRLRRDRQQFGDALVVTDEHVRAAVYEWLDERIIRTDLCPFALPAVGRGTIEIVVLRGEQVGGFQARLGNLTADFLQRLQAGQTECLLFVFPEILEAEVPRLTRLDVRDLPLVPHESVHVKHRFFDPVDPHSHGPPYILWLLRRVVEEEP